MSSGVISNLKINCTISEKVKPKGMKEYATWERIDNIEIDRASEKYIQKYKFMEGVIITKEYYIQMGIPELLDSLLDEEGRIFAKHQSSNYSKEEKNPLTTSKYRIEVTYENNDTKIIEGNFSKQELPEDFEYVMHTIYDFISFYYEGDLFSVIEDKEKKLDEN